MQVKDIMSKDAKYVAGNTNLCEAAKMMSMLDCGFLPIGDSEKDKLKGVVTDRDMIMRGLAEDCDPKQTTVEEIMTDKVLYCFEDDSPENAAEDMRKQNVYRLIVLDNKEDKRLAGVVTLGDIVQGDQEKLAGKTMKSITSKAA